jgi:hypothetical protein
MPEAKEGSSDAVGPLRRPRAITVLTFCLELANERHVFTKQMTIDDHRARR